jgi:cytochrome c
MTIRHLLLAALSASTLLGCADDPGDGSLSTTAQPAAPDPAVIEDGRAMAEANCARCHAVGREGVSPNRSAPAFRTVLARYDRDILVRELIDGMSVAHAPMPQFQFDPRGADALVAYLDSIQVTLPGRLLVEERCARCHAISSGDTSPYPGAQSFRNLGRRWTRDQLTQALRTGIIAEHDASGVRIEMRLDDQEIADFLDFLKSIETSAHPAPK